MEGLFSIGKKMLPTTDQILRRLNQDQYRPAKMKEIARLFEIPQDDYRSFRALVREMVDGGVLVKTMGNRYASPDRVGNEVGLLRVHRSGFGFVSLPGATSDVFIGREEMNGAFDGDTVRIERNGRWSREGLAQGAIVEVIAESQKEFVGLLRRRSQQWVVDVEDLQLSRDVIIDDAEAESIPEGNRVVVRIVKRAAGYRGVKGTIVDVLGDPRSAALDFDTVIRRFAIPQTFSEAALADSAADAGIEREIERRRDLRAMPCITIDPEMARDHDDAVAIEPRAEGGYRLLVHIADVSHFVAEGSALDREAYDRGTSTYLIDRVVHMLPEGLAAQQCSLVPERDRLTLTADIILDSNGQYIDSQLYESIVRSAARLTYRQVQAVLEDEGAKDEEAFRWRDQLACLAELSVLRQRIRNGRGSLELNMPEAQVELNPEGEPVQIGLYQRFESHRIIEECMLLANECVGHFCSRNNLPVLYRVHMPPTGAKLEPVFALLGQRRSDAPSRAQALTPRDFQNMLEQASHLPNANLISKLLLRSLSRAEYTAVDGGHFGLACSNYLHFTSPIRRYPDLLVHRVLKAFLTGRWNGERDRLMRDKVADIGRTCSTLERRAESAERAYVRIKQMRFMERHLGESFDGVVSGVLRSGFFVEIGMYLVDGFCRASDFDEPVDFDEERHSLVLRRSRRTIRLGMPVRVVVCAVDLIALEMDLSLDETSLPAGSRRIMPGRGSKKKRTAKRSHKGQASRKKKRQ